MAVAPLLAIEGLTALQAFVGGTVALLYLPCLSVFGILTKEFNVKVALAIGFSTVITAFVVAGLINQISTFIYVKRVVLSMVKIIPKITKI